VRIHVPSCTKQTVLGSYSSGHVWQIMLFFRVFDFLLSSRYRFDIPKHVCVYVCMYKGGPKTGPSTATFNDLLYS
jgi:hypothetical protein